MPAHQVRKYFEVNYILGHHMLSNVYQNIHIPRWHILFPCLPQTLLRLEFEWFYAYAKMEG